MRTPPKALQSSLNAVAAALARMQDGQGNIARKNARVAFSKAQRRLASVVDANYPAPKRKQKVRKTATAIKRRATKAFREANDDGWVPWGDLSHERRLKIASLGIKAKKFTFGVVERVVGRPQRKIISRTMVPHWVAAAPLDKLGKFKRDIRARKAWESADMMMQLTTVRERRRLRKKKRGL